MTIIGAATVGFCHTVTNIPIKSLFATQNIRCINCSFCSRQICNGCNFGIFTIGTIRTLYNNSFWRHIVIVLKVSCNIGKFKFTNTALTHIYSQIVVEFVRGLLVSILRVEYCIGIAIEQHTPIGKLVSV